MYSWLGPWTNYAKPMDSREVGPWSMWYSYLHGVLPMVPMHVGYPTLQGYNVPTSRVP